MTYKACEKCPYRGHLQVQGEGSKGSRIMVIAETPFISDFRAGKPFISRGGRLLRETLRYVGIPEGQCYYTYLCPCQDTSFFDNEDYSCLRRLQEEVDTVKPEFIILIGADLARRLMPDFHRATEDSGKVYDTIFGVPGLATIHPAIILKYKGASNFPTLSNDLTKVWRRVQGIATKYSDPHTETEIINDLTMPQLLERLNKEARVVAYDWETTGLNHRKDRGWCLGLAWKVGHGVSIPVDTVHNYRDKLTEFFNRQDVAFIAFNGMFDMKFNKVEGLPERLDHDPMLMHSLFDERPQRRSLENLTVLYCDAEPYESQLLTKYGCTKSNFLEIAPPEEIHKYCCKDVDYTLRLYHIFMDMFREEPGLLKVYRLLVIPAARTLADIQERGFCVDLEQLDRITKQSEERIVTLQQEMNNLVGVSINPNSPKQVAAYLWDTLGLQEPDLFGRKARSVDDATRQALLEMYPDQPFVQLLHEYKETYTLLSRYLRKIPQAMDDDRRLRSHYHLDRTETGRLAATDFPIHQMPRKKEVKGILCASPGYSLLQADYAQIEMRMACHLANDTLFNRRIFKAGVDFHSKMASEAYRVPLADVAKHQRQAAKGVSFGLLYLMGDKKLADNTGLPPKDAIQFVKDYKAIMPEVMRWIEDVKQQVYTQRYVESLFGRKRRFPFVIRGKGGNLFELQREAVNMPIQSSASDTTLWQLVKLHGIFKEHYPDVYIVTTVHDSIVVECPDHLIKEIAALMKTVMEKPPFNTEVPFKVDIKVGKRWGEENEIA